MSKIEKEEVQNLSKAVAGGVGLAGYYLKQMTDDKLNGAKNPTSGRGQVFAIGPSVKYSTKTGTTFMAQWQREMAVENRFQGDKLWLNVVMPL